MYFFTSEYKIDIEPWAAPTSVQIGIKTGNQNHNLQHDFLINFHGIYRCLILTLGDEPFATKAEIEVAEITWNEWAFVPPKLTEVALVKSVPVIVTVVPAVA